MKEDLINIQCRSMLDIHVHTLSLQIKMPVGPRGLTIYSWLPAKILKPLFH